MPKEPFEIKLTYFKPSGKLYADGSFMCECDSIRSASTAPRSCYMYDAIDRVKELRTEGKLPGLQSGKWEGPILVDCDEGYPHLIMLEKAH